MQKRPNQAYTIKPEVQHIFVHGLRRDAQQNFWSTQWPLHQQKSDFLNLCRKPKTEKNTVHRKQSCKLLCGVYFSRNSVKELRISGIGSITHITKKIISVKIPWQPGYVTLSRRAIINQPSIMLLSISCSPMPKCSECW